MIKALTDMSPGVFYDMPGRWFLPTSEVAAGQVIQIGPLLPLSCMFEVGFAMMGDQRVGFFFTSRFAVENGGAYLMTYLNNKGPATEHETLVKDADLVVYNFPNKGTLAVCPQVNSQIETIFQEQ